MELEDLKTLWHARVEYAPPRLPLRIKRSQGIVSRMKRNLLGELILVLTIYTPAICFYMFGFEGKLSLLGWILMGLVLLFAIYYYRKKSLLDRMECPGSTMRESLRQQVQCLSKYIRLYTLAGTVLVPVMAILSFLVTEKGFGLSGSDWFWALGLVPVTVAAYYVNTWSVNALYGRHIRRLRHLLMEIEEMGSLE